MNHWVASEPDSSSVPRPRPLGRGRHHINAGLEVSERLIDRKRGRHIGVQRGGRRDLARPNLDPAFVSEIGQLIAAERLLEVAVDNGVDEIAVADPEHLAPVTAWVLTLTSGMPRWPTRGST